MASGRTLDLTIRIAGKMDKSLISAINGAQSNLKGLAKTVSQVGTAGLAAMGALSVGTVKALADCTNAAAEFKNQMGDVTKYVGGLADTAGKVSDALALNADGSVMNGKTYAENYEYLKDTILDLSTQIPYTAKDLTRLAAAAGQSGKNIDEIAGGFLKDAAMWGTAMDISADQAGDWAAKWEQAFNMDHSKIMVLADQINYLGANSATTAAEIASAVNSAASLGQIGGIDVATTAALADAMLATGVSSDRVGTSIKRMVTNISKGSAATKAQQSLWKELGFTAEGVAASMQSNSVGTLRSVFQALKDMPKERQVSALSTLFGQWAIEGGAKIVNNLDVYEKALAMVSDPSLYTGSMAREFAIKAETPEALDMMLSNAFNALKVDVGTAFLPAKKDISIAVIDFINQLRNMPELGEVAQTLADIFAEGVQWAGTALQTALPAIKDALDYLRDNGPQVVKILGGIAGAFATMSVAPGLLSGMGNLLLGKKSGEGGYAVRSKNRGLAGMLSGLWRGGRVAPGTVKIAASFAQDAAGMARASDLPAWQGRITGFFGAMKNMPGLLSGGKGSGKAIDNMNNMIQAVASNGLPAAILNSLGAPGRYVGGIVSAVANPDSASQPITLANSAPVAMAMRALGNIKGVAGATFGPLLSGFGGLLSGALPIVGVISSIIAVVSLLGDHLEDIRGIVGNVFGDAGLAVFDTFIGGLQRIGDFITGLFRDGGVAQAMAPLRDTITGMFGDDAGPAFDALVQVLQSVMSVAGQVVTFANTTAKPIIQEIFGYLTQTAVPILLQAFTSAAPVLSGIISGLGTAVLSCLQIIGSGIQIALPIIERIISAVLTIASVAVPALLAGYETFSAGLASIISAIQTVFRGIIDFVTGVFTLNWTQAWQGVQDIFKGVFEGLGALIKTPLNAVISIINKAISGINSLGLEIPDWVPLIGGKTFSVNIPEMPLLAKGGFTTGPSIAGEAGTEAVISFQRNARSQNIETWRRAGELLGVGNHPIELLDFPAGGGGRTGFSVTFAPHIEIKGNADKEVVEQALEESEQRFEAWLEANFDRLCERRERERSRRSY